MAPHRNESKPHKVASSSKAAPGATSDDSTTTLLISSLPPKYTSDSLSTLLSSVGPIRNAFVVTEAGEDKRSKGYGFAKFVLKDDAEKAIAELNGSLIDGKKISVQWAKRRQRVNKAEPEPVAPVIATEEVKENVVNAYAARRAMQRESREGGPQIDNKQDSRTIILEGGLDTSIPENKKALQNRLKKVVTGINTGLGLMRVGDVVFHPSTVKGKFNDPETGKLADIVKPITLLEAPTPRAAVQLAERLHNTILKGHLSLCKPKFESDLLTRKGSKQAIGRLIVRNLGFDVTEKDLAAVFAPYGFIQSIQVHKGFAFVWYLKPEDADKAIAGVNGKRIYAGVYKDRVEESANHKLSSIVRKEQKGRIVGVKGRIVAVDKALSKEDYDKVEAVASVEDKEAEQADRAEPLADDDESGASEGDESEDDEDDDDDEDEDEDDDADLSPVELDELELPSDAEESEEEEPEKKEDQGTTLFVRNIQFEATEDELFSLFKGFGPVRYARIVVDPVTKRSRGTGFVNFYKDEDALKCLEESERLASLTGTSATASAKGKDKVAQPPSLLTIDPSSSTAASLTLHGRVLGVSQAVSKGHADKLREDRDRKGQTKDRRNLYLMHEGAILPDSPLAANLVTADIQARQDSFEARRGLLRTNPSLYVSRTRLAIRQIPLFVTEGMLRRLAGWAIKAFNTDVKAGKRSKLTIDELREPIDALGVAPVPKSEKSKTQLKKEQSKVKQVKILRQEDRVDILTGQQRSKGYGFLELQNHADALRVIRWANANNEVHKLFHRWWIEALKAYIATAEEKASKDAEDQARTKRMKEKLKELEAEDEDKVGGRQGKTLIIEFSIENAITVKRRAEKVEKFKQKENKRKRDAESEEEEEADAEAAEAVETSMAVDAGGAEEKKDSRNALGSMIGKKRRLAKQKRGGPRKG